MNVDERGFLAIFIRVFSRNPRLVLISVDRYQCGSRDRAR
jgi:hypothetical protein